MSGMAENPVIDRDEQAALWCLDLAEGELSRHEQARFDGWIADPNNAAAFEEAARVWNNADASSEMPELIQMRTIALESYRRTNERRWRRRPGRLLWIGGIAAMLVFAFVTTLLLHDPAHTYRTGISERRVTLLDDGSKLSLDADTEVGVRLGRDRREITLVRGRAKFDVARDPLRPFTVTAGGKIVVATGTSFSVELLNRQVHVLLYEGHVSVLQDENGERRSQRVNEKSRVVAADQALTPGRELIAASDSVEPGSVVAADPLRSLSWEAGRLSFDDEPLQTAAERMNRYSKVKIAVADAVTARVRVTGVFTAGDSEAFVEGVTALNPLWAERKVGSIILRHD